MSIYRVDQLTGKVPLAVLDEEVPGEEEECEGEEEEECVVEVLVADAVDGAKVPSQADDLGIQGERDAQGGQQDVPEKKERRFSFMLQFQ